jgi:hypothetical protein
MDMKQSALRTAVLATIAPAFTSFPVLQTIGSFAAANQSQYASPIDLAWAAGFFDGDGCITATWQPRKGRPNPDMRIVVNVTQNDYRTLQQFQTIVGCRGKIYPLKRQAVHNRQCWSLVYSGQHALAVLRVLLPYLRRKRQEALLCMQIAKAGQLTKHPGPNGHPTEVWQLRRKFFEKLKRLK